MRGLHLIFLYLYLLHASHSLIHASFAEFLLSVTDRAKLCKYYEAEKMPVSILKGLDLGPRRYQNS